MNHRTKGSPRPARSGKDSTYRRRLSPTGLRRLLGRVADSSRHLMTIASPRFLGAHGVTEELGGRLASLALVPPRDEGRQKWEYSGEASQSLTSCTTVRPSLAVTL